MRAAGRSLKFVVLVIACVFAVGWAAPLTTLVGLLGSTALIMGGTGHPLINPNTRGVDGNGAATYDFSEPGLSGVDGGPAGYVAQSMGLIRLTGPADETYTVMAIWTPEAFWPVTGKDTFDASVRKGKGNLDRCVRASADCVGHTYPGAPASTDQYSVFAYSQSARIASLQKAALIDEYDPLDPSTAHHVSFVMIGNPSRPNGGILQRLKGLHIPILDVTFDGASPTGSPVVDGEYLYPTVDIARQYDGWADFPAYPLNFLADLNALAGILYLHGDYFVGDDANPVAGQPYLYQGQVDDTNYYMVATKRLPLLLPLKSLGVPDPILAALDAPLRVLVEMGYNRAVSPGDPTTAQLLRPFDPVGDVVRLVMAVFTGLDDAVALASGDPDARPFGTTPTDSTFGVGGAVLPTTSTPVAPEGPAPAAALRAVGQQAVAQVSDESVAAPEVVDRRAVLDATPQPAAPEATDPETTVPETTAPETTEPAAPATTAPQVTASEEPEPTPQPTAPETTKEPKPTATVEPDPEPAAPESEAVTPKPAKEKQPSDPNPASGATGGGGQEGSDPGAADSAH